MATLLQTPDGDIDVTAGRSTVVTDPVEAGTIKLRNRFKRVQGEWFRDKREGLPWFTQILVKDPAIPILRIIFRNVILTTPPFVSVTSLTITLNPATRIADVSFVAVADDGAIVTAASLNKPFIVSYPGAN